MRRVPGSLLALLLFAAPALAFDDLSAPSQLEPTDDAPAHRDVATAAEDDKPAAPARAPEPEPVRTPRGGRVRAPVSLSTTSAWERWRALDAEKKYPEAAQQLVEIERLHLLGGRLNAFTEAGVLVRASRRAQASDPAVGVQLAETAVHLAPQMAAAHLRLGAASWAENKAAGKLLDGLLAAAGATWTDFRSRALLLSNLALVALCALLLCVSTIVIVTFWQRAPLLVHDLNHVLPSPSSVQAIAFVALLVTVPLVFHGGPVLLLATLGLVMSPYLAQRERGVLVAAMVLLIAVPYVTSFGARWMAFPGSKADALYTVSHGDAPAPAIAALERVNATKPEFAVSFALGQVARRQGDLVRAVQHYTRATELDPQRYRAFNNLANALFLLDDLEKARAAYSEATKLAAGAAVEPYFNLARMYVATTQTEDAQKMRDYARQLNREHYDQLSADADRAGSGYVADLGLGNEVFEATLQDAESAAARTGATAQLWAYLGGNVERSTALLVLCILAVLVAFTALVSDRLALAARCDRCGSPACTKCTAELPDNVLCGQCYHAFKGTDSGVDPAAKMRKEIQVRRYQRRRVQLMRVLTLLGGVGHVIKGAPIRSLVFNLLFAMWVSDLFLNVTLGTGFFSDPTVPGSTFGVARAAIAGGLLLLTYAGAFFSVLKDD